MKYITKQKLHEPFIYFVLWIIIFLIPLFDLYFKSTNNDNIFFSWKEVFSEWINIVPYLFLFIIHNTLLTRIFLTKHKPGWYILSVIATLILFHFYIQEIELPRQELPNDRFRKGRFEQRESFPPKIRPEERRFKDRVANPNMPPFRKDKIFRRPLPFLDPDLIRTLILLFMFGINLAVKLFFKSQRDEAAVKDLERHSLQQELEYLKYQINPHFFMNTLNNIHALVDIDADKAKDTIVELSRLMRYVLYESSNKSVMLSREIEFLNHYMDLMRLRYNDKVIIHTEMPIPEQDVELPPLLFISFVENAFKHGISYQNDSFIHISLKVDHKQIHFHCENSKHQRNKKELQNGMGLENIRKRLSLLFQNHYQLTIEDTATNYNVILIIPIS